MKKGIAQAQKPFCARFWQLRQALGAFPQFSHSNILELLPPLQFTPLFLLLLHQAMHKELQARWCPHQSKAKEERKGKDKSEEQSKMLERWVRGGDKGHLRAVSSGQGHKMHSTWNRGTAQGSAARQGCPILSPYSALMWPARLLACREKDGGSRYSDTLVILISLILGLQYCLKKQYITL